MRDARPAKQHTPNAEIEGAGSSDGGAGEVARRGGPVLYLTADLLARHSEAAGGTSRLERLRIDGLRRRDRIRTLENLGTLPCLIHLELPCHAISSMAPALACSVSPNDLRLFSMNTMCLLALVAYTFL